MKATLDFNLPEETTEFELACQAGSLHSALHEIAQTIFRPARKHGYPLGIGLDGLTETEQARIAALEHLFYTILSDYKIEV